MSKNMKQSAFVNACNSFYIVRCSPRMNNPRMMLPLLATFLLLISITASAQTFTPVKYNFHNEASSAAIGDMDISSIFISTASNGYGTWGVNSLGEWFLLGDSLSTPAVGLPEHTIPTGVIQRGVLNFTNARVTDTKVVANLAGNVRFVCPMVNGQGFIVQGFNDQRATNPSHRNIDIRFTGYPNEIDSRKIIKSAPIQYPDVPIQDGGDIDVVPNPAIGVGEQEERDFRDVFDVAIDSQYLYIVWRAQVPDSAITKTSQSIKINYTIIRLSDGAVINNTFPKLVMYGARRPTIACNIRNIEPPSCLMAVIYHGGWPFGSSTTRYFKYDGALLTGPLSVPMNSLHPNHSNPNLPNNITIQHHKHARIVVTSSQDVTSTIASRFAIYIIGNGYGAFNGSFTGLDELTADDLVLFYEGKPMMHYVDGNKILYHPDPYNVHGNYTMDVCNAHIRAFTNPYDGQSGAQNEEIHCLYQLFDARIETPNDQRRPLFIVRGSNNKTYQYGTSNTVPILPTVETRHFVSSDTVFGQRIPHRSPTWNMDNVPNYCASVNQKGIFVYWDFTNDIGESSIYFNRDYRFLDEDIEEHTLLTYENTVADGTAHQGTVGALLLPERVLSLWTDPEFNNHALTLPTASQTSWQNGRIRFKGSNVTLAIGSSSTAACHDGEGLNYFPCHQFWSTMVMLPNTEIIFEGMCSANLNQRLLINPLSTLEYYGVPTNQAKSNIFGEGTVELKGWGAFGPLPDYAQYVPNLAAPAKLRIHGGSTFVVPNSITLKSHKGDISFLMEKDIRSINPNNTNALMFGRMTVHGTYDCEYSMINSYHNPAVTSHTLASIMNVRPPLKDVPFIDNNCTLPSLQFRSYSTGYKNLPNMTGRARILFDGVTQTENYREVSIVWGGMDAVELDMLNPVQSFTCMHTTNWRAKETAIKVIRTHSRPYENISLLRNSFEMKTPDVNGIWIEGFDERREPDNDKVVLDSNILRSNVAGHSDFPTAIMIKNTDAKLTRNKVLNTATGGGGFHNGIVVDAGNMEEGSVTFLCSNEISKCSGSGLMTNKWKGYGILNTVTEYGIGHTITGDGKNPRIHFSIYENNIGPGIFINAVVDVKMAKLDDGVYDIAGHNTIKHNNTGGQSAQIEFGDNSVGVSWAKLYLGSETNIANTGGNNIIAHESNDYFASFPYTVQTPEIRMVYGDNYWAIGSGNGTSHTMTTSDPMFHNVYYTIPTTTQAAEIIEHPSMECGDGFVPEDKIIPTQTPQELSPDECAALEYRNETYELKRLYYLAYDSMKYYIEQCYHLSNAMGVFGHIGDNAVVLIENDIITAEDLRTWLKSVLYLNSYIGYYCYDALEIARSYLFSSKSNFNDDYDAVAGICKYLMDSTECGSGLKNSIMNLWIDVARYHQYRYWKDTVSDSLATPYDTGYKTLDELDLAILRGPQQSVSPIEGSARPARLAALRVERNPFNEEVALKVELDASTLLRVDVYDELGRQLYVNALGYKPKGEHRFTITAAGWSSGTYYIRLSTPSGEIKTVKVIRE